MATQRSRQIEIFNMDAQSVHVTASMAAAQKCVARLLREGFTVLSVHVGNRNPRVLIQNSARCDRLEGAVAMRTHSPEGRMEIMVADFEGCQVHWKVKGN